MTDYQPKGSQCTACKHRDGPCDHLPFRDMPVCNTLPDGVKVVICSHFERRGKPVAAPPYLCPDGSNPCGRYGYCAHCPHDGQAKREKIAGSGKA